MTTPRVNEVRSQKFVFETKTHICSCGATLDRDENAARNILRIGLSTSGHCGTWLQDSRNAWGEDTSTLTEAIRLEQVTSPSPRISRYIA